MKLSPRLFVTGGLIGLALLMFATVAMAHLASGSSTAPATGNDHGSHDHSAPVPPGSAAGQKQPPGNAKSPEALKAEALLSQGFESDDVYTALNLERRTGVDALDFLIERRKGTEWLEVARKVAPGKVLNRESKYGDQPVQVDDAVMRQYQAHGYTRMDVIEAATLARDYELPLATVFSLKTADSTWRQVEVDVRRLALTRGDGRGNLRLSEEDPDRTETGLTKREVYRLMDEGYTATEILTADQMTRQLDTSLEQILAQFRLGMDLDAIVKAHPHKGTSPGNQGPNADDLSRTIGKPRAEVEQLLQEGATWQEILKAHDREQKGGRPFAQELADLKAQRGKPIKHLEQLYKVLPDGNAVEAEQTRSGMRLDEVNQLLQEYEWSDIDMADLWAERLGTKAAHLLRARKKGMEWEEIVAQFYAEEHGTPLAELADALGVPVELADEITLNGETHNELLAMGLDLDGILRAGLIAKALDRPVVEIATLKTAENTWLDVAKSAKKGGNK